MSVRAEVPSRWRAVALVCGKCSRKVGGGFGPKGKTALAKALRGGAGGRGRKADYGVIETGCLKLCPKRAVVVVNAWRPDRWLLVAPGTPVDEVAERLGLRPPGDPEGG